MFWLQDLVLAIDEQGHRLAEVVLDLRLLVRLVQQIVDCLLNVGLHGHVWRFEVLLIIDHFRYFVEKHLLFDVSGDMVLCLVCCVRHSLPVDVSILIVSCELYVTSRNEVEETSVV